MIKVIHSGASGNNQMFEIEQENIVNSISALCVGSK